MEVHSKRHFTNNFYCLHTPHTSPKEGVRPTTTNMSGTRFNSNQKKIIIIITIIVVVVNYLYTPTTYSLILFVVRAYMYLYIFKTK